jgi:hypothetical protein
MSEFTHELVFGVFSEEGKLILPLGQPVTCTLRQAEFIACLLAPSIEKVLKKGHYFGYDFKEKTK